MNYFTGCKTKDELKKRFKELVKKLHPDLNPDRDTTAEMVEMKRQFEQLFDKAPSAGSSTKQEKSETAAEFIEAISKIAHLEGLEIEICGSWLWVSGATYGVKDTLKAAGFHWASKKKMWYWHSAEDSCQTRKPVSMEKIREKYGSQAVTETFRKACLA